EIECAPLHVAEKLIERLHHHRTAPDHGRVGIGDQAERHCLYAVVLHRQDLLVTLVDLWTAVDPEHHLLRGAVDVGVEHADGVAEGAQGEREVRGDRRLADAALSGRNSDLVFDAGKDLSWWRRALRPGSGSRADIDLHPHAHHARHRFHSRLGIASDLRGRALVLRLEAHRERDVATLDAD